MTMKETLLAQLERESAGTRKALQAVPEGETTGSRTRNRCNSRVTRVEMAGDGRSGREPAP